MPHLCSTQYKFEGTAVEIADLYDKLKTLQTINDAHHRECYDCHLANKPIPTTPPELEDSDYGHLFLGSVVKYFGGDSKEVVCRGWVNHIELLTDTIILIDTETAWVEMQQTWEIVVGRYKTIKYYFSASEPGSDYYVTNDTKGVHFPERYVVDPMGDETEYYCTEGEVFKDISERLGVPITSMEQVKTLVKEWNDSHSDDKIAINEIEVVGDISQNRT